MAVRDWNYRETISQDDLPKDAKTRGYFWSSNDNWDGKMWVRNRHELRIRDLTLCALGDVKDKKILEIGCGTGIYLDIICKMGGVVYGQDIDPAVVDNCNSFLKEKKHIGVIKIGDAKKLLFEDASFDAVFAADFFEHINYEEKKQVISEVWRVLKPGGLLVIKTPNLNYLKLSLFTKRLFSIFNFKSPFNIYIPHTHNNPDNLHCGLTTYTELEKLLHDNMFHSPKITYIPLIRRNLPKFISKILYKNKIFTEQVIISSRKPIFLGYYS